MAAATSHLKRWIGVSAGWVLSSEILRFGEPTASGSTEGNNAPSRKRERGAAPRSRRPQACRETSCARTGRPRCRPEVVSGPVQNADEPEVLDARQRGVVQRHSTGEAAEQKRATAGGGCGGK